MQFTHQNCNLRTLPHHLLKCVISTQISRRAVITHLSVSASTIREMPLHSGLSTFLTSTATFRQSSLPCLYISTGENGLRICTSKVHFMNRLRRLSLRLRQQGFETNLLQKSFNRFFNRHGLIIVKYGATLREMRLAPSYPYITGTYLLLRLFFQLYFSMCARTILFCARALFLNLLDMCI